MDEQYGFSGSSGKLKFAWAYSHHQSLVTRKVSLELVGAHGKSLDMLMKAVCIVMQLGNLSFEASNGDSDKSRVAIKAEVSALSD